MKFLTRNILLVAALFAARTAPAATLHVPAAHPTIQSAITASIAGDIIMVAPGTYLENIDLLGKIITVQSSGGAAVTTIQSALKQGSVVTCIGGETIQTKVRGFTITAGTGTLIDGIATGGGARLSNSSLWIQDCIFTANTAGHGGAIAASNGGIKLTACAFTGNVATNNGGAVNALNSTVEIIECQFEANSAYDGGALHLDHPTGMIKIDFCDFIDNHAHYGGAVHVRGLDVDIDHTDFENNCAINEGGALYVGFLAAGQTTLHSCDFTGNRVTAIIDCADGALAPLRPSLPLGGAALLIGTTSFSNCTFQANTAEFGIGGAIYAYQPVSLSNSTFIGNSALGVGAAVLTRGNEIWSCVFEDNVGTGGMGGLLIGNQGAVPTSIYGNYFRNNQGGALEVYGSTNIIDCRVLDNPGGGMYFSAFNKQLTVDRTIFRNNDSSNPGGAVRLDGYDCSAQFTNCLFEANSSSSKGGALYFDLGLFQQTTSASVINCTFVDNDAPAGMGSAILNGDTLKKAFVPLKLANCILWGNSDTPIANHPQATTAVSFSDIQGGYEGEGNIDVDPQFIEAGNQRISVNSPCVDFGDNASLPNGITGDVENDNRIQNGVVDLGAYEGGTCIGDFAYGGSGVVDVDDLLRIIGDWGDSEYELDSDLNGDGMVDVDDLLIVINNWGPCQ